MTCRWALTVLLALELAAVEVPMEPWCQWSPGATEKTVPQPKKDSHPGQSGMFFCLVALGSRLHQRGLGEVVGARAEPKPAETLKGISNPFLCLPLPCLTLSILNCTSISDSFPPFLCLAFPPLPPAFPFLSALLHLLSSPFSSTYSCMLPFSSGSGVPGPGFAPPATGCKCFHHVAAAVTGSWTQFSRVPGHG